MWSELRVIFLFLAFSLEKSVLAKGDRNGRARVCLVDKARGEKETVNGNPLFKGDPVATRRPFFMVASVLGETHQA